MYGDNISFSQAVVVCVFSLAVVFVVLFALSGLIGLTARIVRRLEGRR